MTVIRLGNRREIAAARRAHGETTAEKALRLAAAVDEIGTARVFHVPSGDGEREYVVVLGSGVQMCSCPAHSTCSHLLAAATFVTHGEAVA